jgi:hypothetical protein
MYENMWSCFVFKKKIKNIELIFLFMNDSVEMEPSSFQIIQRSI